MNVHNGEIVQQSGGVKEEFLEELSFKLSLEEEMSWLSKKGEGTILARGRSSPFWCIGRGALEHSVRSSAHLFEY